MAPAVNFSAREMEVLALAWQCMDNEPKVNFEKLAELAGYKTKESASVVFSGIRRKLKAHAGSLEGTNGTTTPATTPKKPKTPKPTPKRVATAAPVTNVSPTKKKKKAATPKKAVTPKKPVHDPHTEEEDEEFRDVKIKTEETNGLLNDFNEYLAQDARGYTAHEDETL